MEAIFEQLRELWGERRRVVWVALGVAWGTLALTMLLSVGGSFETATRQTVDNFGRDLLRIGAGSTTLVYKGLPAGRRIGLSLEDADALRAGVPQARGIEVEYSSGASNPIRYGQQQANLPLSGCGARFRELRGMLPQPGGRFLNRPDVVLHRRVCFLGDRAKQRLFGDAPAVGAELDIHGRPFLVVGVRQPRVSVSSYNGNDRDKVAIPYTSFHDLLAWRRPSFLLVGLKDASQKKPALAAIYRVLAERHGFDPADSEALDIFDYMALADMIDGMLGGVRFNSIVGLLGLLVSMLGVMNVMYVMVEERRREIGLRMAIGARPRDILREQIVEALAVTLSGGLLGIAICAVLLKIVAAIPMGMEARAYIGFPRMSLSAGLWVTLFLAVAGSVAGGFPARRAASLDPIEALREE